MTASPIDEPAGLRASGVLSPSASSVRRSAAAEPGFGRDVDATLRWAATVGGRIAAEESVAAVWETLAVVASRDVAAARILEPHVDALRILHEAAQQGIAGPADVPDAATWGVFAAEGSGMRVTARRDGDRWRLDGTKPWCSLAGRLSHALVTAWVDDDDSRGLFAVSLGDAGVHAHGGPWHSHGFPDIVSAPVDFDDVPAAAIGDPGWYLARPGFARGGMGVAACWWGGASALLTPLCTAAAADRADQLSLVHLGRADAALWAARAVLVEAADVIDGGAEVDERLLAARVRATVSEAAQLALDEADEALGPLPLVADVAHARRTADLRIYLRQQHGARDVAGIGRRVVAAAEGR
ncbi:acyl-CoA dehydrogenase [Microbacterium lemovicicum]|uniref:acyl-CoA dehydrogenase n=1 Tax=Microbacterium lemovicicum TaxID=1072463 RepID=UPI00362D657B